MEIKINLKNVSKEEIEELKKYLEENCWDWKVKKNVPRETWTCCLLPVDYTCGLWCVLVGGTHPYFLFLLEGWWNTTSPLVPF